MHRYQQACRQMTIIDAVYTVLNMHLHIYIQLANVYALHFTNVHLQCV